MNRSELAALLAANPPVPNPSSPIMFQDHMQNPITSSPISPRLAFQSRVRKLQLQRSPSRPDLSTHRRRHSELEQVSTLRVTHKRSLSAQPAGHETPDFWADEREAWGQRSPKSPQSLLTSTESNVFSPARPKREPILSPTRKQTRPIPQPRKQTRARAPFRTFEPLHTITDTEERPKTSRGPLKLEVLEEENEEDKEGQTQHDGEEDEMEEAPRLSTSTNPGRSSKFIEGSMNERSFGIASSWFQEDPSDSDKPLPPTPLSKHVTFSCTPVRESLDEQEQGTELPTTKRKERKGLRRSISNFNFQALSEKIKNFSGPSHETATEIGQKKPSQRLENGIDILNERKRKADEAYAAQFGFKKQKFSGTAAPSPNVGSGHGQQMHSRNVEHQSSHNLRPSTYRRPIASIPPSHAKSHGLRHKKSRRELEREIADLRACLSTQQQDLHQPATNYESFNRGKDVMLSPGKRQGKLGSEDLPPVPRLPGRGMLRVLENNNNRKGMVKESKERVCVSRRNSEDLIGGERKEWKDGPSAGARARGGWEWPEDVF